jgi:hypothetical protein
LIRKWKRERKTLKGERKKEKRKINEDRRGRERKWQRLKTTTKKL